jgi:hypothetical protein
VYCLPSNEIVNPAGGSIVMVFLPAIVAYVVHPLACKTPRRSQALGLKPLECSNRRGQRMKRYSGAPDSAATFELLPSGNSPKKSRRLAGS